MIVVGCNLDALELINLQAILDYTEEAIYVLDSKLKTTIEDIVSVNPVEQAYLVNNVICDWSGESLETSDSIVYCTCDFNVNLAMYLDSPQAYIEDLQTKLVVKYLNEL